MLYQNRLFNNMCQSFATSGLGPHVNGLAFASGVAMRQGGFGALASVPRGYGLKGMAPCMKAGSMAAKPEIIKSLTFGGNAPINMGISMELAPGQVSLTFGGYANLAAIVWQEVGAGGLRFGGSAPIYGVATMVLNPDSKGMEFGGYAPLGAIVSMEAEGGGLRFGGYAEVHAIAHLEIAPDTGSITTKEVAAISRGVWEELLGGTITAEDAMLAAGSAGDPWTGIIDGMTARDMMSLLHTLTAELHKIQGLDATTPVTHAPGSITAGDIAIDLGGDNVNSRTKTRRA